MADGLTGVHNLCEMASLHLSLFLLCKNPLLPSYVSESISQKKEVHFTQTVYPAHKNPTT